MIGHGSGDTKNLNTQKNMQPDEIKQATPQANLPNNFLYSCPYCNRKLYDKDQTLKKRCMMNDANETAVKCYCKKRFGVSYDEAGQIIAFTLPKHFQFCAAPLAEVLETGTKQCNRCKKNKELELFYKNATGRKGRSSICIDCDKITKERAKGRKQFNQHFTFF